MASGKFHDTVYEAIIQAFLILLKTYDYDEISVSMIVRKAGVSRSSFYRNFIDKDDVLEKYICQIFSKSREFEHPYDGANLKETIIAHYQLYYENREFLKTLHKNGLLYRFMNQMRLITEDTIQKSELSVNAYQSAFFSAANLGVLGQWLDGGCKEPPQEIAEIINTLLFHTPGRDFTA